MKQHEVAAQIGHPVRIIGYPYITMNQELKHLNGKHCMLIKQCKSGLLQVKCEGKFYSIPMHSVDVLLGNFRVTVKLSPKGVYSLDSILKQVIGDIKIPFEEHAPPIPHTTESLAWNLSQAMRDTPQATQEKFAILREGPDGKLEFTPQAQQLMQQLLDRNN